jgi:hypothetical protein
MSNIHKNQKKAAELIKQWKVEDMNDNAISQIKAELDSINLSNTEGNWKGEIIVIDDEVDKLSKALSVAVAELEYHKQSDDCTDDVDITLKSIADILSGEGGGK